MACNLFVCGIKKTTPESTVRRLFKCYSSFYSMRCVEGLNDKTYGAILKFSLREEAEQAIKEWENKRIDDAPVTVRYANNYFARVYVSNLPSTATSEIVLAVFSKIGQIEQCILKTHTEKTQYALIQYSLSTDARRATEVLDKTTVFGPVVRVRPIETREEKLTRKNQTQDQREEPRKRNWRDFVNNGEQRPRREPSRSTVNSTTVTEHTPLYSFLVYNLPESYENKELAALFSPFNPLDATVIVDRLTLKTRCFGVVRFSEKIQCEKAMSVMNGYRVKDSVLRIDVKN